MSLSAVATVVGDKGKTGGPPSPSKRTLNLLFSVWGHELADVCGWNRELASGHMAA